MVTIIKMVTKLLKYFCVFALTSYCYSQDGSNDSSFNKTDKGFDRSDGPNLSVYSASIQSDGKIIIGGNFTSYNGTNRNRITRLNSDGSLDRTFSIGTGVSHTVTSTAIQSNGKIIIGGIFSFYNGIYRPKIARLNIDGSLDTTFNPGNGADNQVESIAIQSSGKILIGGNFTSYNGTNRNRIARLNPDGSLDTTFNVGTGANHIVTSTAIQNDGKIIVCGGFERYNETIRNGIARLNSDGSLDASFNPWIGANSYIESAAIQEDGKIIIGGSFTDYNGTNRNNLARLNIDGSLDSTFMITGTGINGQITSITIQSDGKIIVGGGFNSYNGIRNVGIVRLNSDGSMDNSFNHSLQLSSYTYIESVVIQNDSKIIMGIGSQFYKGNRLSNIRRLNTDGSVDARFNPGTGADNWVKSTAVQSDGKIIIGGYFRSYNGMIKNGIARLNIDGSVDTTFNPGTGANNGILAVLIQSDGKLIIAGDFTSYNGINRNYIARLNIDGSLDTTFNPGTGANREILTMSIQSDGKILIGGHFTSYNGTNRNYIARLNIDGSLDTTFNPGIGANYSILTMFIQSDGKIIIGGIFTSYNGTNRNRIARLNPDGSLDTTFNIGTGANNIVKSAAIQNNGKILIGGIFTSYNGMNRNYIACLNADGSLDTKFNPGTGADREIASIALHKNGKILIGGYFKSYNGTIRDGIARLNTDGSLDTTFKPGTGVNNGILTMSIQNDGKIIIGGNFTSYDDAGRNRVARINAYNNSLFSESLYLPHEGDSISIFPNPVSNELFVKSKANSKKISFEIFNTTGKIISSGYFYKKATIPVGGFESGIYILKLKQGNTFLVTRIIKE